MNEELSWYAVMSRAGMEGKANTELRRLGFWTFYPFERVRLRRKIPNRDAYLVTSVERPLFSRYLFVAIRPGQSMRSISDAKAVATVVYMAGEPLRIAERVIDAIMERADEDGLVAARDEASRVRFEPGQVVRFVPESPLAGLIFAVAADAGKSVKLVAQLFGAEREMEVHPSLLESMPKSA
ncbi:transcription termination/antitermination protein NusG [Xanthobacteraceae bacterium A53D]